APARELANRLEHPVALLSEAARAAAEQALVQERGERLEIGVADGLDSLQRAPSAEDAQSREQPLFARVEQVVRPRDRRPERRVSLLGIAGSLEGVESVTEPLEKLLRRQQLRSCSRELEREREAIQALAQLGDGLGGVNLWTDGPRPLAEKRHRLVLDEGRKIELDLALDAQCLPARRKEPQRRYLRDELCQRAGGSGKKVLDVVADDMRPPLSHTRRDRSGIGCGGAEAVAEGGE